MFGLFRHRRDPVAPRDAPREPRRITPLEATERVLLGGGPRGGATLTPEEAAHRPAATRITADFGATGRVLRARFDHHPGPWMLDEVALRAAFDTGWNLGRCEAGPLPPAEAAERAGCFAEWLAAHMNPEPSAWDRA